MSSFTPGSGSGDGDRPGDFYSRIPVWNGVPTTLRQHKIDIKWWLAGENLPETLKFNLAARYASRQRGAVRQRILQLDPDTLAADPGEKDIDGDVTRPPNYRKGIDVILKAYEEMVGADPPERKAELRDLWHKHLYRRRGERIIDWCTRFRDVRSQLAQEGITFSEEDAGWHLRDKSGLSDERLELLDTATGSSCEHVKVQSELIRLFRKVHLREQPSTNPGQRGQFFNKFRPGNRGPPSSTSFGSRSSASSWRSSNASSSNVRHANAAEAGEGFLEEEPPPAAETSEEVPPPPAPYDGGDDGEAAADDQFEAMMSQQLDALATELEEAEAAGVDEETIAQLEDQASKMADAFITMREAKHKMLQQRKDRKYGGPSGSSQQRPASSAGQRRNTSIDERKKTSLCRDCLGEGHWQGDACCPKPGAGLGKKKPAGQGGRQHHQQQRGPPSARPRQAHIVESEAENVPWEGNVVTMLGPINEMATTSGSPQALGPDLAESLAAEHAAMTADSEQSSGLEHAVRGYSHVVMETGSNPIHHPDGALDSACNRTLSGHLWMFMYLKLLQSLGLLQYVVMISESERFRFGNSGCLVSNARFRVPVLVASFPIHIWISVVTCAGLGLLIGKDIMRSLALKLDFLENTLDSKVLGVRGYKLCEYASVGHLKLPLMPGPWIPSPSLYVIQLGSSGVVELPPEHVAQLDSRISSRKSMVRPVVPLALGTGNSADTLLVSDGEFSDMGVKVMAKPSCVQPGVLSKPSAPSSPGSVGGSGSDHDHVKHERSKSRSKVLLNEANPCEQNKASKLRSKILALRGSQGSLGSRVAPRLGKVRPTRAGEVGDKKQSNRCHPPGMKLRCQKPLPSRLFGPPGRSPGAITGSTCRPPLPSSRAEQGKGTQSHHVMSRMPREANEEDTSRCQLASSPFLSCAASKLGCHDDMAKSGASLRRRARVLRDRAHQMEPHVPAHRSKVRVALARLAAVVVAATVASTPAAAIPRYGTGGAIPRAGEDSFLGGGAHDGDHLDRLDGPPEQDGYGVQLHGESHGPPCSSDRPVEEWCHDAYASDGAGGTTRGSASRFEFFRWFRLRAPRRPAEDEGWASGDSPLHGSLGQRDHRRDQAEDQGGHGRSSADTGGSSASRRLRSFFSRGQGQAGGEAAGTPGERWLRAVRSYRECSSPSRAAIGSTGGHERSDLDDPTDAADDDERLPRDGDAFRSEARASLAGRGGDGAGRDGVRLSGQHGGVRDGPPAADAVRHREVFLVPNGLKAGDKVKIRDSVTSVLRDSQTLGVNFAELDEAYSSSWEVQCAAAAEGNEAFISGLAGPSVTEVFTDTEPIVKEAARRGHATGRTMTLNTGYDLRKPRAQERAMKELMADDPYSVVLAFPCSAWSSLMSLNPGPWVDRARRDAKRLVEFAVRVARWCQENGKVFVIENPLSSAASRMVLPLKRLCDDPRVSWAIFDQCMLGLKSADGVPHKKATLIITNAEPVARRLHGLRCDKSHRHAIVIGGKKVSERAGHYPAKLASAIVDGIEEEFNNQWRDVRQELSARRRGDNEAFVEEASAPDDGGVESDGDAVGEESTSKEPVDKALLSAIKRLHVNTGHRPVKELARALAIAGAPAHVVRAARQLKCDVCQEVAPPRPHRPAVLPRARASAFCICSPLQGIVSCRGSEAVQLLLSHLWDDTRAGPTAWWCTCSRDSAALRHVDGQHRARM